MRGLLTSDFFHRFAGGFVLGAVALAAMQPGPLTHTLSAVVGTATDVIRAA